MRRSCALFAAILVHFEVDSAPKFVEIAANQHKYRVDFDVAVAFAVRRLRRNMRADSQEGFRVFFADADVKLAAFGVDFASKFVDIAAKTRENSLETGAF